MPTTFTIQSSGCPANLADFEQMAGLLQKAGFTWVETVEEAYVVLCNPKIKPKLDLPGLVVPKPRKIVFLDGDYRENYFSGSPGDQLHYVYAGDFRKIRVPQETNPIDKAVIQYLRALPEDRPVIVDVY